VVAPTGGRSPFQISLRASQRRFLKAQARGQAAPWRVVVRARIVLDAAAGLPNALIARRVRVAPNTVLKWRKRFFEEGFQGLRDRKRPGRPRVFPAAVLACAKAVACELPATRGVPLSRWSLGELRQELIATGLVDDISTTTLWRWLDADAIKPWQHRSWIFPRDPEFAARQGWRSTCTRVASPAVHWAPTSSSSPPTRRPASRPAAAAIPPCHRARLA
jgi:transposase